ncbi:substrate-binding domain-containing protein [uncultured Boseongicola sp.]|jgi:ribose transport system substrate-binding protein|uniref:substrate-binding domain-containing protein n=1 Tax=uncultured Boseongicola sp. TaxID=1648499 RepID=UPI00263694D9|nr:substrate-binding domain-containing protein [uncultured Boseongicola sp.]
MTIIGLGPHGERASPPERVTLLPQDIAAARAKGLRIALVMHTLESDWSRHLVQGVVGMMGECGAIVIDVVDCNFSPEAQIAALRRLCDEKPDAIVSLPVDNTTVAQDHIAVSNAGIKLVLIDNVPTGMLPGKDYAALVSVDNYGLGKIAAELLSDHLPANASTGLLGYDADFFAVNEREIAFSQSMERNRPDVTVRTARFSSLDDAGEQTRRMLADYPDVAGLFVVWDTPCIDVIRMVSELKLTLPITTVDLGQEVTENLAKGGAVVGIAGQRPFQQGEAIAKTTITALLGRPCPDWVALPGLAVTRSNVIECYQSVWRKHAPREILVGLDVLRPG